MRQVNPLLFTGLLGLTLLVAAGDGAAQDVVPHLAEHEIGIVVEEPTAPVQPITDVVEVPIQVTVGCEGIETNVASHPLAFTITATEPWTAVSLDKTVHYLEFEKQDCPLGTHKTVDVLATVAFTADAPAGETATFTFAAALDTGESAEETFQVTVGTYERWQAYFETPLVKAPPNGMAQLPLTIENRGNGPIQVAFDIHEETSRQLLVALPGPQLVPTALQGGDAKVTIPIDVRTSNETDRRDRVALDLSGRSDDGTMELTPLRVTAVVETSGIPFVGELPVAGALPLMLTIVAFAALRRP